LVILGWILGQTWDRTQYYRACATRIVLSYWDRAIGVVILINFNSQISVLTML